MNDETSTEVKDEHETLVEGLDFYIEDGLVVLTRRYLLNRSFCCDRGCRHCPYKASLE